MSTCFTTAMNSTANKIRILLQSILPTLCIWMAVHEIKVNTWTSVHKVKYTKLFLTQQNTALSKTRISSHVTLPSYNNLFLVTAS